MNSYEDRILEAQESTTEYCMDCKYKTCCRSQCIEISKVYNPMLK